MTGVKWTLVILGIPAGLFLVDGILLKLEEWGWIFYRRNKPNFKNAGSVFLEMQAMFEPRARYVIERKQKEESDEDEDDSGDPPVPGVDPHRP
jgi:hypothetical protein